jgi:hypothetical protein
MFDVAGMREEEKEVSWSCASNLKGSSMEVQWKFDGSFKEAQWELKRNFTSTSRSSNSSEENKSMAKSYKD